MNDQNPVSNSEALDHNRDLTSTNTALKVEADSLECSLKALDIACASLPRAQRDQAAALYQPDTLPEDFRGANDSETIDKLLAHHNADPVPYQPEGLREDLRGSNDTETIDKLLGYIAGLVDAQKSLTINSDVAAEKLAAPRKPKMLENARVILLAPHLIGGVEFPKGKTLESYTGPKSRNMKVLPKLVKTADAEKETGD